MRHLDRWLAIALLLSGCGAGGTPSSQALSIPPLIDSAAVDTVEISLQHGRHRFFEGVESKTMGFNGDYLGPTVRLHRGQTARLRFTNAIGEASTVHGHGLHVSGEVDGGPQQRIAPGESWAIDIPVRQQAGTSWYHPHKMGATAHHVHAGLAGLYLIDDPAAAELGLPVDYGVDDIPLVVQDRDFVDGVMQGYEHSMDAMEDGLRGETLVVNGGLNPHHTVPRGWVRLRLLNGSNARFYRFYLSGDARFYKIATEGGFLNSPLALSSLEMAPGERNEIMVDLRELDRVELMAEFLPADPEDQLPGASWFTPHHRVVELRADSALAGQGSLPTAMNAIQTFSEAEIANARVRELALMMEDEGDGQSGLSATDRHRLFGIDGEPMDMDRIDQRAEMGRTEIWRITGDMMPHPFHVHGTSFLILSHNGQPPAAADRGWKDTVVVTDQPTEVIMRFDYGASEATPYMYHCHILEHEDGGMMGQFTVQ